MLYLDEDEGFSMTANVLTPGYQSTVLSGYVVSRRSDGTYAAPLLPQLFYGADGNQLSSWRQYIPQAGSQTILSKPAGHLLIPRGELYWRKVSENKPASQAENVVEQKEIVQTPRLGIPVNILIVGSVLVGASILGYLFLRRK